MHTCLTRSFRFFYVDTIVCNTIGSTLRTYSSAANLSLKNTVDARMIKTGFNAITFHLNEELNRLLRTGHLTKARQLFDRMPHKNICSLNSLVSGYVKFGHLNHARELFDEMSDRDAVSWTIIIGAYSDQNQPVEAFRLYASLCTSGAIPDYVTFTTLLRNCDETVKKVILQVHSHIIKLGHDSVLKVCNSLVDSYCKSGSLDLAFQLLKEMPNKDSVTFNTMIKGFSQDGLNKQAISLLSEMQRQGLKPSEFTFAAVLCASMGLDNIALVQQIHGLIIKTDFIWNVFVANALLDFYSKHDCVVDARNLFDQMPELDGVSYNIMITCYARNGKYREFLYLYEKLQSTKFNKEQFPFSTMLSLASNKLNLKLGRQIHAQALVSNATSEILVANSLIDMYAKCNKFKDALVIFDHLPHKSSVPWTAMISAHAQNGEHEEALKLFKDMQRSNIYGDQSTFASTLKASANLASLSLGKQLHSTIIKSGFMSNVFCGSSVLDMYAKCGSIKDAIVIFDEMPHRNNVSWNALISAYAQNGEAESTFRSFDQMVQSGLEPDSVTFLMVLTACSHSGLVNKGLYYFNLMIQSSKVAPEREHYASIVDVLCRNGLFNKAEEIMSQMPFDPDEIMCSSILNSCRIHKNQELARKVAARLFDMKNLRDGAAYVNMSNIYAEANQWENVAKVKMAMRDRGIKKLPAYSWVEIKSRLHIFTAGGNDHPRMPEIRRKIDELGDKMEKEGYKPNTSCVVQNVEEEYKAESLKYHSERLAIVFCLISTPSNSPILVLKNLRACVDCHAAIKVISKIVGREITVRDSSRFHHFKDGVCSCGDYW